MSRLTCKIFRSEFSEHDARPSNSLFDSFHTLTKIASTCLLITLWKIFYLFNQLIKTLSPFSQDNRSSNFNKIYFPINHSARLHFLCKINPAKSSRSVKKSATRGKSFLWSAIALNRYLFIGHRREFLNSGLCPFFVSKRCGIVDNKGCFSFFKSS